MTPLSSPPKPALMCLRFSYLWSACFHLSLFWLIAMADDSWLPDYAVRSGRSGAGLSRAARARSGTNAIDTRLEVLPPTETIIKLIKSPVPELRPTPADADLRIVPHPPTEKRSRRRPGRSTVVAEAPMAEFAMEDTTETPPKIQGWAVPPVVAEPISESQTPTLEATHVGAIAGPAPAPGSPVLEPGNAERNAINSHASSGALVDRQPNKLPANPEPIYPEELRRLRIGGTVMLRVLIKADGLVEKVTVERSSGQPALDDSAVAAVEKWRFEPARRAGIPVRIEVRVPITFSIRQR